MMPKPLPLLIFPKPNTIRPSKKSGFPVNKIRFPDQERQRGRLTLQIDKLKASFSDTVAGLEPETVLVIEIIGRIEKFQQAVENAGLEWLGEWDTEAIEPDEDFYEIQTNLKMQENTPTNKKLNRRMFVSFLNQQGQTRLLSLWDKWKNNKPFERGETKWKTVFAQAYQIRKWGIEETLRDTGMIDRWQDITDPVAPKSLVAFQKEFFYRKNKDKRKQSEDIISKLLSDIGGSILSSIDMPDIAFHAVKAQLPAKRIKGLLKQINSSPQQHGQMELFKLPGIMYFRPTGQSIATFEQPTEYQAVDFKESKPKLSTPVAAILDGGPHIKHSALQDRVLLDDPDNLLTEYQPGERQHGTAMAGLVIHGDLSDPNSKPLASKVYHRPIMQPDPKSREFGSVQEYFPDHVFFEDRVERAVRRMFEGEGKVSAQAPTVKIINLSIADPERPFIHTPSPLARLLDYLSFKYRVLFCVSAGNFTDAIKLEKSTEDFKNLDDGKKQEVVLKSFKKQLSERRLLSPAESLNALTIGALHADQSGSYNQDHRIDLLPHADSFPSPISRFGYGFHRSIKPEILFPGGRQLYMKNSSGVAISFARKKPGQQTVWDSSQAGENTKTVWTSGTSNATALATRSGVRIHEMLSALNEQEEQIPKHLMAVLIKTLLVHSAEQNSSVLQAIEHTLITGQGRKKEIISRYMGYGNANVDRVLSCTKQRGTVIGFGELKASLAHEYKFPLPFSLSGQALNRRMLVTLAWFSPINPGHRNFREAKLEIKPSQMWKDTPLKLKSQGTNFYQSLRGTVQHGIFEKDRRETADYGAEEHIVLQVTCKADATEVLEGVIPYGLAVTLEVEEGVDIPIYQEIRQKLTQRIPVLP